MNQLNPVFIPGPTNLPESVRRVIDQPTIDHRSPAFASLLPELFDNLKKIFATQTAKIFVFPGTKRRLGGYDREYSFEGRSSTACRHGVFSTSGSVMPKLA